MKRCVGREVYIFGTTCSLDTCSEMYFHSLYGSIENWKIHLLRTGSIFLKSVVNMPLISAHSL